MKFKKLDDRATIPVRATRQSAGYDLCALNRGRVPKGERLLVPTGITWETEPYSSLVGFIKPRSGLAYKNGIDILAGVIDADYRNDIGVILYNTGDLDFYFDAGSRIAQLVVLQFFMTDEDGDQVIQDAMEERDGGFGSTDEKGKES